MNDEMLEASEITDALGNEIVTISFSFSKDVCPSSVWVIFTTTGVNKVTLEIIECGYVAADFASGMVYSLMAPLRPALLVVSTEIQ